MDQPREGEGWIHEVFDECRAQIIVDRCEARVFIRNGHNWSAKFWPISLAAQALPCNAAIIRSEPSRLCFVAFHLLYMDGRDLRAKPLIERRAKLADL